MNLPGGNQIDGLSPVVNFALKEFHEVALASQWWTGTSKTDVCVMSGFWTLAGMNASDEECIN